MSLVRIKDYTYIVFNDEKVPQESSYIVHISYSTWSSLAPNGLATQPINWVKSILN